MSLQVTEIANFKTGIDKSIPVFLSPNDAFVTLENGFAFRGELRSREGYRDFANGGISGIPTSYSRMAQLTKDENKGTTSAGAEQTIASLTNAPLSFNPVTIKVTDSVLGEKIINIYYNAQSPSTPTFLGDVDTGGTNTINWTTGAITVTFDAALTGGDDILVTYSESYENTAILGIHERKYGDSSRDLVVMDRNYGYLYGSTNNFFSQIPFAGSAVAFSNDIQNLFSYTNFKIIDASSGITAISTTEALIFVDNNNAPMVYNGTDIRLLSDRSEYTAPPEGVLNKARHVFTFGERLIFLDPTIDNVRYPQAVLWGPINDNSGNGLDFTASGSGILSANTNSEITAAIFLKDTLIVWFEDDVFSLELTSDAFAPFRWTRLEHYRGVEAPYSAVGYLGIATALGKINLLETDARRVRRPDNNIPYFTRDEIYPNNINLVYGIEQTQDSQFWWAYPSSGNAAANNDSVLVENFEENNFSTFTFGFTCADVTDKGASTAWDDLPELFDEAFISWDLWGQLENRYKTIFGTSNGSVMVYGDNYTDGLYYISGITKASSAVITLGPHTFKVNDRVVIQNVEGMTEINTNLQDDELDLSELESQYPIITAISDTTITVNVNSTNFTTYTSGGYVAKPINFNAKFVPFSPARSQGKKTYLGRIDFLVETGTGEYWVNLYDDRKTSSWTRPAKTYRFSTEEDNINVDNPDIDVNDTDEATKVEKWFTIYVDHEADFHSIEVSQFQLAERINIKSMRIWWRPGGESNN